MQVHDLPLGCMSKGMARELGNFIKDFLNYDATIITKGLKKFMLSRVRIDIRNPIHKRKTNFI